MTLKWITHMELVEGDDDEMCDPQMEPKRSGHTCCVCTDTYVRVGGWKRHGKNLAHWQLTTNRQANTKKLFKFHGLPDAVVVLAHKVLWQRLSLPANDLGSDPGGGAQFGGHEALSSLHGKSLPGSGARSGGGTRPLGGKGHRGLGVGVGQVGIAVGRVHRGPGAGREFVDRVLALGPDPGALRAAEKSG